MWSSQAYLSKGREKKIPETVLNEAIKQIETIHNAQYNLPAILSLNHLAIRTEVNYNFLRAVIRRNNKNFYSKFSIKKRSGGRRFINIPTPQLMKTQKWINTHILINVRTHSASHAFSPQSSIYKCAIRHCGAKWLIKMDVTNFFESISEIQIYRLFHRLGYSKLISFELARICTLGVSDYNNRKNYPAWQIKKNNIEIPEYSNKVLGYLPQGAPTSPMLSNLVMLDLDEQITQCAKQYNLLYTRYSDDLTFSTKNKDFSRKQASKLIAEISEILTAKGLKPQYRKTAVIPPSSRKIVLGLQVDGDFPRLRKEFKDKLRQHFYFIKKYGLNKHFQKRSFDSISGFKNHLRGLIDYANMVEPEYAEKMMQKFNAIDWPI